ncbi:MAG: hypothetical protein J6P61_05015 [Erysipelotrichaceae bacterium]|nr:hypothetical protein [Erysipelotrichaceae bacterium]
MAKKTEVTEKSVDMSQYRRIQRETETKTTTSFIDRIKGLSKRTISIIAVAVVVVIAAIVLLTGKGKSTTAYTSQLSDGKTTICTGDVTITKQGYYEYLLKNYGADEVVNTAYNTVAEKEIDDKDALKKKIKELKKDIKSYMGSLDSYASAMGYDSAKELEEKYIKPQALASLLNDKYLKDNFDTVCSTYKVTFIKQVTFEKESDAVKAIKKATTKKKFDEIFNDSKGTDLGIVTTKTSSLDEKLSDILGDLSKISEDGTYSEVVKLSTDQYAVLYIYNTNKEKHKDDITTSLAANTDIAEEIEAYYLKKYKFSVKDKGIREEIKKNHSSYIN